MLRKSQLFKAIFGFTLFFVLAEILASRLIKFAPAHLDNNSFIVKRRIFEESRRPERFVVFLGSSGFARGIDCLAPSESLTPCYNLSLDGGDAFSFAYSYKRFISPLKVKPKMVIFELCEMTFGPLYDSQTAMNNFIITPGKHLKDWWSLPVSVDFKQALKNEVDSYFLWSSLYQLSRRERLAHWPEVLAKKKFSAPFVGDFSVADPKKVLAMKELLVEMEKDGVKASIIAQGELHQGVYTNAFLAKSEPYKKVRGLADEKLLTFHEFPEKSGFKTDFFTPGLIHVKHDQIPEFTKVVRAMVEEDLQR